MYKISSSNGSTEFASKLYQSRELAEEQMFFISPMLAKMGYKNIRVIPEKEMEPIKLEPEFFEFLSRSNDE